MEWLSLIMRQDFILGKNLDNLVVVMNTFDDLKGGNYYRGYSY